MNWFEKIKRYYDLGCYTDEQVYKFVIAGKITEEEYNIIVGKVEEDPKVNTKKVRTSKK